MSPGPSASRLAAGVAHHFNNILSQAMRDWYTPDRVCEVLRRCGRYGINTFNYVNLGRSKEDFQKFLDEGGKMHLVAQVLGDPVPTYKQFKPLGIYRQGEDSENPEPLAAGEFVLRK